MQLRFIDYVIFLKNFRIDQQLNLFLGRTELIIAIGNFTIVGKRFWNMSKSNCLVRNDGRTRSIWHFFNRRFSEYVIIIQLPWL